MVGIWVERRRQKLIKDLGIPADRENRILEGLRQAVETELKIDYVVTGSWSNKARQEATRLIGKEHVNVVAGARDINERKFGKIPEEKDWKLSNNPAMAYYCDNETVGG